MSLTYRKAKRTLAYQEGKPTVYKATQLVFPQVTSDELIQECSNSCGVNPSQTRAVVTALIDRMVHYMTIGHGIKLESFGSFKPVFHAKCVKTSEEATADTITLKKIQFRPGKKFVTMLDDLEVKSASETLND